MNQRESAQGSLDNLVKLQLSTVHHAGNMPMFGFGKSRRDGRRLLTEYSLHVSCAWRLESKDSILTGDGDWFRVAESLVEGVSDQGPKENMQQRVLRNILGSYDDLSKGIVNSTPHLFVSSAETDSLGGCTLKLSPNYLLVLFPSASNSEAWRLLAPDDPNRLFVLKTETR
jgi:hypothetical protein